MALFGGQLTIPYVTLVTIAACIVIVAVLVWFTGKTKKGKAMRACSEDKGAAQLMGINVNRTISMTFAIGSALAAIAGVLLCSYSPVLQPTTGAMPGIKAFDAAVFGGIGSIPGAVIGGFIIGICESLIKGAGATTFSDAFTFALLIVVLWKYEEVLEVLGYVGHLIFPFLLGGAIAFVLNVPMNFIERHLFMEKVRKK